MKPADLKPGDRIDSVAGVLTVDADPFADEHAWPELDLIAVDVVGGATANPDDLRSSGAAKVLWMSSWPHPGWRLFFASDSDLEVSR